MAVNLRVVTTSVTTAAATSPAQGNAIGDFGMIGAIIDHYDAMVSLHVYRGAHSSYDALRGMYELRNAETTPGWSSSSSMHDHPIGSIVEMCDASVAVVITTNRTRRLRASP